MSKLLETIQLEKESYFTIDQEIYERIKREIEEDWPTWKQEAYSDNFDSIHIQEVITTRSI